ncbi:two-component sensor histidine kinase [Paracoccus suum]|uniref:histidine kinase n=1 Tax=Paracoccus suum TaxID=2259340 RepID=A0A344PKC9_9RHOB|nr:ATP-binding protein [Paracoccus suum]AXC49834.1 two-component sensor histidine kinase [Paracoccus suum]
MDRRLIGAFLTAVPVPLLAVDERALLIGASPAAEAMLGPAVFGRPFVTLIRQPSVIRALESVLDPARPQAPPDPGLSPAPTGGQRLRVTLPWAGRDHACEVTVAPLAIGTGRGALVAIEDLTALEQAEQMRREFVANVSHELRTPLTALMGFIETLRGPARDDAPARERFLAIMEREAGRMNRLVADLLSLSRVEANERQRPAASVDLAGLIRATVATLAPAAEAAGVRLRTVAVNSPVMVPGDADQLVQVLHNLIENAIKYGGGTVSVALERIAHEPVLRGPAWAITVSDTGDGIDPLHLPRLTERFYRVDTHRAREQGGTGLGLAIVKHIIGRHRGRLRIESEPGKGSRFTAVLPESQDVRRG